MLVNGSYCEKEKKSGGGRGGQGRCERRSEALVKIQKNKIFFFFFWGGGGNIKKKTFFVGGRVVGGSGWM